MAELPGDQNVSGPEPSGPPRAAGGPPPADAGAPAGPPPAGPPSGPPHVPPAASAPAGPPPSGPTPARASAPAAGSRRGGWGGVAVLAVVCLAAAAAIAVVGRSKSESVSAPSAQRPGEVFLEPSRYPGQQPFSSDTDKLVPQATPVVFPASTTTSAAPSTTATTTTTATTAAPPVTVRSSTGTTPGLYGGTRNTGSCDSAAIAAFLRDNPDKAGAWAGALGIETSQIDAFLATLTPVVLLADTRVTNHGYRDGKATPLQSVLQAGTAVLVDATGVPRVKCACGNPLKEPVAQTQSVTYTGYSWPQFQPETVTVVSPGPKTDTLVVQDLNGGDPFARPVGTSGGKDAPAPADVVKSIPRVPVSMPSTTTIASTTAAKGATTTASTTTAKGATTSAPATTVLPGGDFCARVKAYEKTLDTDYVVDSQGKIVSGKSEAELVAFVDRAMQELAAVAPPDLRADFTTVSDWVKPTMTLRDLFGEGAAMPQNVLDAATRMNAAMTTRCPA